MFGVALTKPLLGTKHYQYVSQKNMQSKQNPGINRFSSFDCPVIKKKPKVRTILQASIKGNAENCSAIPVIGSKYTNHFSEHLHVSSP